MFIGTAMCITAFPVLARILKEGGLIYTKSGSMAMGAAALNDAAAWCLLVLAISIANSGNLGIAGFVFLSVVAFTLGLIFLVRPPFWRLVKYVEAMQSPSMNNALFCFTLILVFLSAWTTALLGLDSIFGAFIFGLIMPRDSHLFRECNEKIEEIVLTLTLPLYFALSGLKTDVTQISTGPQGAMVVLVCFIATIGKYVGAGSAAYFSGMSKRESCVIAALMNTRGLVELIVLNLGVSAGILSTRTFSVMVVMCLVTTFMTCPAVDFIYPMHLRVLNDADCENSNGDDLDTDKEETEGKEQSMSEKDLQVTVRARIGVVIDRMEHMQGMMELLACFIPSTADSELAVTAIKAFETNMTDKDMFIGLNYEGRLINVVEESTMFHDQGSLAPWRETVKGVRQELLPLSMFLRAVGATVKAYRMRGDANEFPREIKNLTVKGSCNLLLFPWRESQYVERLFWGSVRCMSVPIALVVMLGTTLTPTIVDIATGAVPLTGIRSRSESVATARSIAMSGDFDVEAGGHAPANDRMRVDSPTRLGLDRNRSESVMSSSSSVLHVDDIPPMIETFRSDSTHIRSILAVVTGSPMDIAIFPMMLRFSERHSINIKMLVTSDRRHFPQVVIEALSAFRHSAESCINITVDVLTTPSSDVESILQRCSEKDKMYDMIIFGYKNDENDILPNSRSHKGVEGLSLSRLNRSASLFSLPAPDKYSAGTFISYC